MKCPDKDLTDGLHDMWEDLDKKERASTQAKLCPKCGSEMNWNPFEYHWYCKCGHEEEVSERYCGWCKFKNVSPARVPCVRCIDLPDHPEYISDEKVNPNEE